MDPLAGSSWSTPGTVAGFVASPPNDVLLEYARAELTRRGAGRLLDIGCGAGRNAGPLTEQGWDVLGLDLSWPMLAAAAGRPTGPTGPGRLRLALAAMEHLPVATGSIDFVVAHGIWNLAASGAMFRQAVLEAARAARPGAPLFVFTFSRNTLPAGAQPVPGERFVFTQFSGQPQCFLTEEELVAEMRAAGFERDPVIPIREYSRPAAGTLLRGSGPVIYEGLFRRR